MPPAIAALALAVVAIDKQRSIGIVVDQSATGIIALLTDTKLDASPTS
jgi:hypothetical protein